MQQLIHLLFVAPVPPLPTCHAPTVCVCRASVMSAKGFGKEPQGGQPKVRAPSEAALARDAAGKRLDEMRAKGLPEFSVWVRLIEEKTDPDQPDFPWLPVGSMCVPRSADIVKAIYDVEDDLVKGMYKLFPNMKDKQFEFGWQNKEFPDEDIQVAERPSESIASPMQKFFSQLWGGRK